MPGVYVTLKDRRSGKSTSFTVEGTNPSELKKLICDAIADAAKGAQQDTTTREDRG